MKVLCDHCGHEAGLVRGSVLHPHRPDLIDRWFWRCVPCGAYVGCHKAGKGYGNGTKPLGRLANAELRQAKQAAHAAFDPLWESGRMTRRAAYRWLARKLGVPVLQCHIGLFDVAQCQAVVTAVRSESTNKRNMACQIAGQRRELSERTS